MRPLLGPLNDIRGSKIHFMESSKKSSLNQPGSTRLVVKNTCAAWIRKCLQNLKLQNVTLNLISIVIFRAQGDQYVTLLQLTPPQVLLDNSNETTYLDTF